MVARDVAPSRAFAELRESLIQNGVEVVAFLGNGKPFDFDVGKLAGANAVLLGMSSSRGLANEEIAGAEAAQSLGVPFGFYSDTYGVYNRLWIKDFRDKASFLFVINRQDADKAQQVFTKAKIVISGNPMWDDFFFPRVSYREARERLRVADEEKMVLCPGSKRFIINALLFGSIIEAAHLLSPAMKVRIFLALHPADEKNLDDYSDFVRYSKIPVKVVSNEEMPIFSMIPGCDIMVEWMSTSGIEAACQRKPVIDFFTEIALNRMEELIGSREWEPCKLGAMLRIDNNPFHLSKAMKELLTENGFVSMRRRQEEIYPKPTQRGAAIKIMIQALKEIAP